MNKAIQTLGVFFFIAGIFGALWVKNVNTEYGVISVPDPTIRTIGYILLIVGIFAFLASYWLPPSSPTNS